MGAGCGLQKRSPARTYPVDNDKGKIPRITSVFPFVFQIAVFLSTL